MKLICGPMATLSHPAFRILVEKFGGCDEYFTEMINAGTLITNGPFEKYYLDATPVPQKIVWQLTSKNTPLMIQAAQKIIELPGIGLDLNMGCSAPDIYRTGAGIGWMLKPISETEEMVRGVAKIVEEYNKTAQNKKRFSVKLRLGDDNFTDDSFFDFCKMLVDCGVQLLTLHPRTKKEKLKRPARYEYCQKLKEKFPQTQIYLNGNVCDENSLHNALLKAPSVDGVMIARASVQKPWIFKELKEKTDKKSAENGGQKILEVDMQKIALDFISDVEKYQPLEFWPTRLQRFFGMFCMNFMFSHYAQTQFLNAKDNTDLRARINDFFEKCPEEKIKKIEI